VTFYLLANPASWVVLTIEQLYVKRYVALRSGNMSTIFTISVHQENMFLPSMTHCSQARPRLLTKNLERQANAGVS